ncbi:MAG: bifunctional glycosyltransferase/CDP-glycerol:glycerophosphate glycerophosphotransferase [Amnibacterium sp.]
MTAPFVSIIAPMYNVERYLPEFFASIEAQTSGMDRLEVVLVDDGSPDASGRLGDEFAERHPGHVQVIRKPNGGQGSARNLGIERARGTWLCFIDPDDVVVPEFFQEIFALMAESEHRGVALYSGHVVRWNEEDGQIFDDHPHSFRYREGNAVVDLRNRPNFVHGLLGSSLFRADLVREQGVRFDVRLHSSFEDGKFVAEYLLRADEPILGLADRAVYRYRRRADGTSTNQLHRFDPRTYTDVPRFGYLELLEIAAQEASRPPHWVQYLICYNVFWLFKVDHPLHRVSRAVDPSVLATFADLMREVTAVLEPDVVLSFDIMHVPFWMKQALAYGYGTERFVDRITVTRVDTESGLVRLTYRFTGPLPEERFWARGSVAVPHHATSRPIVLLGRTLLTERIVWLAAAGPLRAELDGRVARFSLTEHPNFSDYKLRAAEIRRFVELETDEIPARFRRQRGGLLRNLARWGRDLARRILRGGSATMTRAGILDLATWLALRSPFARRAYGDAWLLMDKNTEANDSAEELYRWIRANRPDRNIWFTVDAGTPDHRRLKQDGFKLVAYGSFRWRVLLLSCSTVVSSHADAYVTNPLPRKRFGLPQYAFVFLQHGIIKGDLSGWLNQKAPAMVVTSTEAEYAYLAGDGPYAVTSKEVRLTGLPRHDALLRKSGRLPEQKVTDVVIAPTWREYLVGKPRTRSTDRAYNPDFMASTFAEEWSKVLHSEKVRDVVRRRGLRLVFMPHPNLQPYLEEFRLPPEVVVERYGEVDAQEAVARTACLITDYSSTAFNAAYLGRPVIYFQFDAEEYIAAHTEGPGYYDYRTDGFGPVVPTADEVADALERLLEDPAYRARYEAVADRTFPVRDGRNSERVFDAITAMSRRIPFAEAIRAAAPDTWSTLATPAPGTSPSDADGPRGSEVEVADAAG